MSEGPLFDFERFEREKEKTASDKAREAFEEFDQENPQIWDLFVRFTTELIDAGHKRSGARLVIERIRWEAMVSTTWSDGFKINDHTIPYYARKFMSVFPEHGKMFETRKALADK